MKLGKETEIAPGNGLRHNIGVNCEKIMIMRNNLAKEKITAQDSTNQGSKFVVSLRSAEENARWEQENTHICSITGETYVGYGNNAYPFPGRCSDDANHKYVIPARLMGVSPEYISKWGVSVVAQAVAAKAQELGWKF